MSFPNIKITDMGRALFARVITGERVQFTRFSIGSGECGNTEDWVGLTNLINHELDVDISNFQRNGEVVTLHGEFPNSVVERAFWWREIGIYATLPDIADFGEIMCFYGNAEDLAEYVPGAEATVAVTHRWDTSLMVSGNADVSAIVHSVTYVTSDQLNAHTNNQENPHKVTASQIGLGKVPNVATNDQTPTFSIANKLEELVSGEKLSVAFGKIACAIRDLVAHIGNKNNPHGVTAKTVQAAPENHRSTGTTYGMANESYFGHAKITDDTTKDSGASDGIAASPKFVKSLTNAMKYAGSSTVGGAANSAAKLVTARKVTVDLGSEAGADFDGSKEITPGVKGILPMEHGGLGASTPEKARKNLGIITPDEIANLYVWKKYTNEPNLLIETEMIDAQLSYIYQTDGTTYSAPIYYANNITIIDGELSLVDRESINYSSATVDTSVLLGKYIECRGSRMTDNKYKGFHYIPDDATFTATDEGLWVSSSKKLSVNDDVGENIGFVTSKESNTYPEDGLHSDGYWYVYHKQLGD